MFNFTPMIVIIDSFVMFFSSLATAVTPLLLLASTVRLAAPYCDPISTLYNKMALWRC
jgi:hypothetical protein